MKSAGNPQGPSTAVSRRALFGSVAVAGAGAALVLGTALAG